MRGLRLSYSIIYHYLWHRYSRVMQRENCRERDEGMTCNRSLHWQCKCHHIEFTLTTAISACFKAVGCLSVVVLCFNQDAMSFFFIRISLHHLNVKVYIKKSEFCSKWSVLYLGVDSQGLIPNKDAGTYWTSLNMVCLLFWGQHSSLLLLKNSSWLLALSKASCHKQMEAEKRSLNQL